jgi:hypothetical protein
MDIDEEVYADARRRAASGERSKQIRPEQLLEATGCPLLALDLACTLLAARAAAKREGPPRRTAP